MGQQTLGTPPKDVLHANRVWAFSPDKFYTQIAFGHVAQRHFSRQQGSGSVPKHLSATNIAGARRPASRCKATRRVAPTQPFPHTTKLCPRRALPASCRESFDLLWCCGKFKWVWWPVITNLFQNWLLELWTDSFSVINGSKSSIYHVSLHNESAQ